MPSERAGEGDWTKEFQKANTPAPKPPSADPDEGRRRQPRFEIDDAGATLETGGFLSKIGLGKSDTKCRTLDLSSGGACLLVQERHAPGAKFRIRIRIEKYDDEIDTQAEVRWCHQNPKRAGVFTVGVKFLSVDESLARKISLMQEWFTSPQYKALQAGRARKKGDDIQLPP